VIGIVIFAVLAFVVIGAFAAQISRRHRYEQGEYDPDDV
jgi:Tfp pilus assembly protein PilE